MLSVFMGIMIKDATISPWRVLIPIALGTGLSLIGDTSLYAVLPTHTTEAGVTLASLGILLSANRFIRLFLNGPIGWLYDRSPRRYLFVASLFTGATSTALYALTSGFWPLLAGRLLWGISWAGIWVGGNTIILDISQAHNRGRWVGIYQISFFMGAASGAILGGLLTDWANYHQAMGVGASLTLLGAIIALLFLPETRDLRGLADETKTPPSAASTHLTLAGQRPPTRWVELGSAMGLLGVNRLVLAGILLPTFGLFLAQQIGDSIQIASLTIGVTTLTGLSLGLNALISMGSTSIAGSLSDRIGNRWQVASGGLLPGIAGFSLLASASPLSLFFGIPLTALAGGSNQSLTTALVGDLSAEHQQSRHLGVLFTIGDLASAIGPPLAYTILIPQFGLSVLYLLCAGLYGLMLLVSLRWSIK